MNETPRTVLLAGGIAATLALSVGTRAQSSDLDKMIEQRDAKLAGEWRSHADWVLDFDEARSRAKKNDEIIFAYFTRSYAP